MQNENNAKFVKGIVNDQLSREPYTNVPNGLSSISKRNGEYIVDFYVSEFTDSIKELLDDVQNITKCQSIVIVNKNNVMIRLF